MSQPLLDQALRVTPQTRRAWLKNLSPSKRAELQSQMDQRGAELGITPPTKTTAKPAPRMDDERRNSIRSGSIIGSQRAVKVGRHIVMIPAQAAYKKTRDNLCYVHYRGVISGWSARGAKLSKLKLDGATKAHVARTLFNVRT